ncbi:FAD binding domain protein [Xylariales sp. PMI_506]|nr:FAD binding domain protein [Xylariales sp. PMI_506]
MSLDTLPILHRDTTSPDAFQEAVWSRVFNHRRDITRVPRAVVKPTSIEHIKAVILLAKQERCRVSIRSGGHSWAIWSVRDDAILIDLGDFKFIDYNDKTGTVACSPSTTGKELQEFLATKGRSFPSGHMTDIGLGGFLLGGGFGWNSMNIGQACEMIVSFDVVTAEGDELHCSQGQNEDLFWLAHGGGPGFPAIITRFVLRTIPHRPLFMTMIAWPVTEISRALPWALEACRNGDSDTECLIAGMQPPHSPVAAIGFIAFSFKQTHEEALELAQTICANHPVGAAIKNICIPSSIPEAAAFLDSTVPEGSRICADTAWLSDDAAVVLAFTQALFTLPSRHSSIIYMYRPRTDIEQTAFLVTSHHFFSLYATWEEPKDDEDCVAWVRKTYQDALPFEVASAISDADFQARTYKFWSAEDAERVMEVRKKWDSQGRFCGYLDAGDKSNVEGLKMRA